MTESQLAENGAAPSNSESAIVAAISSMSELLVSSITSLKFTMTESLGQMKDTIDHLAIEEGSLEENAETEEQLEIAAYMDQRSTQQSDKNQQSGSAVSNSGAKKPTSSQTTEQSINTLINQSSESQRDVPDGEIDLLSGIANDLKLDQKKAPAINEQIAKIVHGLMREKLTDEVLTATQNRYNTPENCECLTSTKVNHLIWDKLKPDTRSADIKLQRVQSNLVKGLIPVVSMAEKLVQARDKIPKDALDAPYLIRAATDAIALIGAANFELNMRRRENIKPELNEDYKHLCFSSVPFTDFLFGNDADLSKQLKDLAEATKVSKKLNPKVEGHKSNGYRGYKHAKSKGFGYKYSSRGPGTQINKHLNWKRPGPPYNKKDEGRRPNK